MGDWTFTRTAYSGGRFLLHVTKLTPGGRSVDVSTFRGAPTRLDSYSSADPFGDSTATFTFPSITAMDDLDAADLSTWLGYYSDVDLWWAPVVADDGRYAPSERVVDPLSELGGFAAPYYLRDPSGRPTTRNAAKLWEGFVAVLSFDDEGSLQIQCQGALFQVDRRLAKPFYPARPWPLERLIADEFDHAQRPDLRTGAFTTVWPAGWARIVPAYVGGSADVYAPMAKPGTKWTGYTARQTGSWDHALTGFIQDQLTVMITRPGDGVPAGNQWTLLQQRAAAGSAGRTPVLQVRDRLRTPDFAVRLGTPGVKTSLSGDSTQSENVIYGSGTDVHGTVWRNAVVASDGSRTDYLPLAASRTVWPTHHNPAYQRGAMVSEANTMFGTGFAQADATDVARQQLARDSTPGWTGTITLSTDPSAALPRWQVQAGMTVLLQGFAGSGDRGVPFHVSAVQAAPNDGTVELTVDTRYRDLLTVQEALERTRDPLTPVKMLQVNRQSVMIPDVQSPWDYSAGSGFIPKASKAFHDFCPVADTFPYADWAGKHPPLRYPGWYVKCDAGNPQRKYRWAGPIPILTSEKGSISRTELACYDAYGRVLAIPFHLSIYYLPVTQSAMPRDAGGPSAFLDNAFESIDPNTGLEWPKGNYFAPPDSFIVGWGNQQNGVYNRAGFYPGSEADGASPTGLFVDGATWQYDNTNNIEYNRYAQPGQRQRAAAVTLYAMIYAEYFESCYFMGRLFRANPGVSD